MHKRLLKRQSKPRINIYMRFYEFKTIKTLKLLTPAQAPLKQQQTRAKDALTAERNRQKQAKATERVRSAQQNLVKAKLK